MENKVNEFLTIVDETIGSCDGCSCGKYTHIVTCGNGRTYHVCEDCFNKYFVRCDFCGKYSVNTCAYNVGEQRACSACYDRLFTRCRDCGKIVKRSELTETVFGMVCKDCASHYKVCPVCGKLAKRTVHTEMGDICEGCAAENGFTKCSHCGEWYKDETMTRHGCMWLCESCASAPKWKCARCGAEIYEWEENNYKIFDETVCVRCYDDLSMIDGYGHTRTTKRFRAPDEAPTEKYFGMELEMEARDRDRADMVAHIRFEYPDIPAHIKYDGSLSNGAEFAFYPATRKYLTEIFPLDDFCQTARDVDAVSHNSNNCGLHVHVSRAFFSDSRLAYAKMCIMLDRVWDNLVVFSRRDYDQIDGWAKKNEVSYEDMDSTIDWNAGNRYLAINDTNANTIEFRVFRGSLMPNTIRATLEFVDIFTDYAENHGVEDCCELTWDKLFENASDTFRGYCRQQFIEMN